MVKNTKPNNKQAEQICGGGGCVREMGKNKQINKPTEQTESKTDSTTQGGKRGRGKS